MSVGPSDGGVESREEVLARVREMLVDVIGEDYLLDVEIAETTSFENDLELESVEFVALAERLAAHYGESVDFVSWLAELELEEIIDLKVGDVVEFIVSCRT